MASQKKKVLIVNVMLWVVAALVHPVANVLPTASGEPPKIYGVLLPIVFMLLAYGSTVMMARALNEPR
jgi:hypothetical protein